MAMPASSLRLSCALALLALGALGAAGCPSDSLAPRTLEGTFELRSIGGRPLPAAYDSNALTFAAAVHGSLTFAADGHVVWRWVEREVVASSFGAPLSETLYNYDTTLPYTLRGTELKIGDDCPPDPAGNCAGPIWGRVTRARVVLTPYFSRGDWRFYRVRP